MPSTETACSTESLARKASWPERSPVRPRILRAPYLASLFISKGMLEVIYYFGQVGPKFRSWRPLIVNSLTVRISVTSGGT
jgi:hypothetical protein